MTLYAAGQDTPSQLRLRTHGGQGDLIFRFAHAFTTERIRSDYAPVSCEIRSSSYQYELLDLEEKEIVVYHWHPTGVSAVTMPHLHVSAAGAVELRQRAGSRLAGRKTYLGDFHLPTARIHLEDVVELLIREFSVDPLRNDWEVVLNRNRETSERLDTP